MASISFPSPWKHFMYGKLGLRSENLDPSVNCEARWSYHVVPIVKLNDNQLYILDPIINPSPVRKEEYYPMKVQFSEDNLFPKMSKL